MISGACIAILAVQSIRSATAGSIRDARIAGTIQPASAAAAMMSEAATNVGVSPEATSNSSDLM
jgi:hypothetical protein